MSGAISPLPQYAFMAWCLVKHNDNFTLPLRVFINTALFQHKYLLLMSHLLLNKKVKEIIHSLTKYHAIKPYVSIA
jgi:hypothetical protein